MKWPPWRREKPAEEPAETTPPEPSVDKPSAETRRAQQAARDAAIELVKARNRRVAVETQAKALRSFVAENHFAEMIARELGRGA